MKISRAKLVIICTVLIDVIGIGIVIPVMPFYVQTFNASPMLVTALFAVFSLFAFISAPLLGALSDRIGRRPVLIASIASTALGWFVFASAHRIWLLFLGRIIDGSAAGNFPIAQSYLSDLAADSKERTTNLGIIGATFGIGFVIGPTIGGILAAYSMTLPFIVVGFLATLNCIAAYFFLPETHTNRNAHPHKPLSLNPLRPLVEAAKDKVLRSRFAAWFFFGIAAAIQQSVLSLYFGETFKLTPKAIGYTMAATGIVMAINQGLLLKQFWLKRFSEAWLERWLFALFALGYLIIAAPNIWAILVGLLIASVAQAVLRAVMSSRVSGIAGPSRRGEVMGIMSSVQSMAMVIGPLVGGATFLIGQSIPFAIAGLMLLISFAIMQKTRGKYASAHDDKVAIVEPI